MAPLFNVSITGLEPRANLDVAGRTISFLLGSGAAYSVLVSFSGPFSSDSCQVTGVSGKLTTRPFTLPLYCYWEGYTFSPSWSYLNAPSHC